MKHLLRLDYPHALMSMFSMRCDPMFLKAAQRDLLIAYDRNLARAKKEIAEVIHGPLAANRQQLQLLLIATQAHSKSPLVPSALG